MIRDHQICDFFEKSQICRANVHNPYDFGFWILAKAIAKAANGAAEIAIGAAEMAIGCAEITIAIAKTANE